MTDLLNRRELGRRVLSAAIGVGSSIGISAFHSAAALPKGPRSDILRALGLDQFHIDPATAVQLFSNARIGVLSSYFQLFWPLHHFIADFENLDDMCRDLLQSDLDPNKQHRYGVFPLVARIHALADASDETERAIAEPVVFFHRLATDPSIPLGDFHLRLKLQTILPSEFRRRDASEIIWLSAVSALIRNHDSWRNFRGDFLSTEAARFCEFFLREEYPELVHASVCAFQFLLSYEKALTARRSGKRLETVRSLIQRILEASGDSRSNWFTELQRSYEHVKSREDAPSNFTEIIIGHDAYNQPLADFAIRLRTELTYQHSQVLQGKRASPFQPVGKSAGIRTPGIFSNYGIDLRRIERALQNAGLHRDARRGLTVSAVRDIRQIEVSRNRSLASAFEEPERANAPTIQWMLPFRKFDRKQKFWNARKDLTISPTFDGITDALGGASALSVTAIYALWTRVAGKEIQELERNFSSLGRVSIKGVEREFERPSLQDYFTHLSDFWREHIVPLLRTTVALPSSSAVAGPPARPIQKEMPMSTDRECTPIPQRRMSKRKLTRAQNDSTSLLALREKMYESVRDKLEKNHLGQYVMFDIASGEYVIGSTHSEVIRRFEDRFSERSGFIRGIGFRSRV